MPLDARQVERYQRHILLKEIGGAGQQKLATARILLIGMGGLGNSAAQYLAAAGVGHLGLADNDHVSLSNLQRQILFNEEDIGARKVDVAAHRLAWQNPDVVTHTHTQRVDANNINALLADYHLVLDGCDNFATRLIVNDACYAAQIPLVSGAVGRFDGQIATFKPWLKAADGTPLPCYRSLVPEAPDIEEDCATSGIIGALTGVIGALMALEVIKEITGAGDSLAGRLLVYDGLAGSMRTVKLNWDPANPNNGARPSQKREP